MTVKRFQNQTFGSKYMTLFVWKKNRHAYWWESEMMSVDKRTILQMCHLSIFSYIISPRFSIKWLIHLSRAHLVHEPGRCTEYVPRIHKPWKPLDARTNEWQSYMLSIFCGWNSHTCWPWGWLSRKTHSSTTFGQIFATTCLICGFLELVGRLKKRDQPRLD